MHVGSLWTSHGRRLAKVTFSSETATGWQVARLAEPIPLRPGRTYVASYHTNTGRYAAEAGVFANGATIGNSTIRATSGVRRYGAGGFPVNQEDRGLFRRRLFHSPSLGVDWFCSDSIAVADPVCAFDLYIAVDAVRDFDLDAYHGYSRRRHADFFAVADDSSGHADLDAYGYSGSLHRTGRTQSAPYPVGRRSQLLEVITITSAVCQSRRCRMG